MSKRIILFPIRVNPEAEIRIINLFWGIDLG
jgi:hypothetical protein